MSSLYPEILGGQQRRKTRLAGVRFGDGQCLGADPRMSLSEQTIQDHLKSIFAKTGARDRVTVLSRALGTRRQANALTENRSRRHRARAGQSGGLMPAGRG